MREIVDNLAKGLRLVLATASVGLVASVAEAADRCPPGTRTPAAIGWWVVLPFFVSMAISAPMAARATRVEEGRMKRLLGAIAIFLTGFGISLALFVQQITRCVPA